MEELFSKFIAQMLTEQVEKAEADFDRTMSAAIEAVAGQSQVRKIGFLVSAFSESSPETNCVFLAIAVARLIQIRTELELAKIAGDGS